MIQEISIGDRRFSVDFEYEKDDPSVGYKGGYCILEVTDESGNVIWTPTIKRPPYLNKWQITEELEFIRLNQDIKTLKWGLYEKYQGNKTKAEN